MSTLSYIFTEELTKFTFNVEETHEKGRFDDDIEEFDAYWTPIPILHDIILMSVMPVIGLSLNAIIFRCYFSVKSDVARYSRVLSVFDSFAIVTSLGVRCTELAFPRERFAIEQLTSTLNIAIVFTMIAPLFLALDRFLIVWFPHNFQLHERKMRVFKTVVFVLTLLISLILFWRHKYRFIFVALATLLLLMQFLSCIILYTVISVRIFISERKMNEHRHVGNRYCI